MSFRWDLAAVAATAALGIAGPGRQVDETKHSQANAGLFPAADKGEIPGFAKFCGIALGTCTTPQFEQKIGKGKVRVGGHPNSGRFWQFRDCSLASDGFDYDSDEIVIDFFSIGSWKGRLGDVKIFQKDKGWPLADVVSGESAESCAAKLKKAGFKPVIKDYGVQVIQDASVKRGKETVSLRYTLDYYGDIITILIDETEPSGTP